VPWTYKCRTPSAAVPLTSGGLVRRALGVDVADAAVAAGGFHHCALLYRAPAEYLAALQHFVRQAASNAEPVLVAVPGHKISWLRQELGPESELVAFTDMSELGRNPARIIPSVRRFVDRYAPKRTWYVGEAAWPERSADELRETARHEALVNVAFAEVDANMMCPYDAAGLPDLVVAGASCTHRTMFSDSRQVASTGFLEPPRLPPDCDRVFLPPPADTSTVAYDRDLRPVRAMITLGGRRAGLSAGRATDLMLAASEVAANTLRHTMAGGVAHLWRTESEVICQVHDTGVIADPLAGRHVPDDDLAGGQGLWLVNQICDLVELRTNAAGTTIRMHMRLSDAHSRLTAGPHRIGKQAASS
jgi:anti-sigma regulatory factor (Ser/Thr protein kinase)